MHGIDGPVSRVFIGDLAAFKIFSDERGLMRAMVVLIDILKSSSIPCISLASDADGATSEFASFVDVLIKIDEPRHKAVTQFVGLSPHDDIEIPLT